MKFHDFWTFLLRFSNKWLSTYKKWMYNISKLEYVN